MCELVYVVVCVSISVISLCMYMSVFEFSMSSCVYEDIFVCICTLGAHECVTAYTGAISSLRQTSS